MAYSPFLNLKFNYMPHCGKYLRRIAGVTVIRKNDWLITRAVNLKLCGKGSL